MGHSYIDDSYIGVLLYTTATHFNIHSAKFNIPRERRSIIIAQIGTALSDLVTPLVPMVRVTEESCS
jgi:hypothetical protein